MKRQLDHLVTAADRPNVTIQVLPLAVGAHSGIEGSFEILQFSDEADPDTVFTSLATGGVFQDKPEEVGRYVFIFDRLGTLALTPDESKSLIAKMAKEP